MTQANQWEEADELLGGSTVRTARFGAPGKGEDKVPGSFHKGTVVSAQRRQATVYDPTDATKNGQPKFWPSGDPVWELVITIQTTEQDDGDDDGLRRIYAQGQMLQAIKKAVQEAKAPGLRAGGELGVLFERTERMSDGSGKRRNLFRANYVPPAPGSEADSFFSSAPAPAAPAAPEPRNTEVQQSMLDRLRNQQPHPSLQETQPPF